MPQYSLCQVRAETQNGFQGHSRLLHLCSPPCCIPLPAWPQDRWLAQAWSGTTAAWCTPGSQGHPACHPARLTTKKNVISRHFMDKRRGAGSEAIRGQASWSFRGNQSPRNRPPIDPSRPGVGSHRQQWTWGCSRSWGWERVLGSAAVSVSVVLPPFPVATARPSCPSR